MHDHHSNNDHTPLNPPVLACHRALSSHLSLPLPPPPPPLLVSLACVMRPTSRPFPSWRTSRGSSHDERVGVAAARSVGLLVQEADRSYLPSPLPDLLGRVLAVHNVKVLVFGWSEEVMAPWAQAARPPTSA
jgi:hypothetical protein